MIRSKKRHFRWSNFSFQYHIKEVPVNRIHRAITMSSKNFRCKSNQSCNMESRILFRWVMLKQTVTNYLKSRRRKSNQLIRRFWRIARCQLRREPSNASQQSLYSATRSNSSAKWACTRWCNHNRVIPEIRKAKIHLRIASTSSVKTLPNSWRCSMVSARRKTPTNSLTSCWVKR